MRLGLRRLPPSSPLAHLHTHLHAHLHGETYREITPDSWGPLVGEEGGGGDLLAKGTQDFGWRGGLGGGAPTHGCQKTSRPLDGARAPWVEFYHPTPPPQKFGGGR